MVSRPPPRAAARLAGRRPGAAQGGRSLLRFRVHELGRRLDPFQNLSAHYLLAARRGCHEHPPRDERRRGRLRELWEEFEAEVPEPDGWSGPRLGAGVGDAAGDDRGRRASSSPRTATAPLGMLEARGGRAGPLARRDRLRRASAARREGVAKALLRACAATRANRGRTQLSLDVLVTNTLGETVWRRLGFEPVELVMAQRSTRSTGASGTLPWDRRARRPMPRPTTAPRSSVRSRSSCPGSRRPGVHRREQGGWIRIVDPLLDADREARCRSRGTSRTGSARGRVALALEHGAVVRFRLYERGLMVDEYLSVPTFYGALDRRRARARGQPDARRAR